MATELKNKPATPLPWAGQANDIAVLAAGGKEVAEADCGVDAAYIAHAASAYPSLVALLQALRRDVGHVQAQFIDATLRQIGESS